MDGLQTTSLRPLDLSLSTQLPVSIPFWALALSFYTLSTEFSFSLKNSVSVSFCLDTLFPTRWQAPQTQEPCLLLCKFVSAGPLMGLLYSSEQIFHIGFKSERFRMRFITKKNYPPTYPNQAFPSVPDPS